MLKGFLSVFEAFFVLLRYPLYFFLAVVGVFMVLCGINIVILLHQGKRFKKPTVQSSYKKLGILKRLLVLLPRQYAMDLMEKDPDEFTYKGVVIFTGRQGNGKTSAMVKCMLDIQAQFPLCKVITNLAYKYEDAKLNHWKRLIDFKNGSAGVVAAIDETQNWFSSNQSKNFPPEMLQVITQNRKNRRIVLGTAQNFYLLAKALRSQCTEVRECVTFLGCITFVRRREPLLDSSGEVVKYKDRGIYFFVHDEKLRNAYDTYKVIENLKHSGFQEQQAKTSVVVKVKSEA